MKQFSLDEYLKNPQRKVITREGLPVRIICTDRACDNKGSQKPIMALVNFGNKEVVYPYTSDGISSPLLPKVDLFFAQEKKEGWVNIYTDNRGVAFTGQVIHSEYKNAETAGRSLEGYLTTAKIEWEEQNVNR